jgi:hypothetical protein
MGVTKRAVLPAEKAGSGSQMGPVRVVAQTCSKAPGVSFSGGVFHPESVVIDRS